MEEGKITMEMKLSMLVTNGVAIKYFERFTHTINATICSCTPILGSYFKPGLLADGLAQKTNSVFALRTCIWFWNENTWRGYQDFRQIILLKMVSVITLVSQFNLQIVRAILTSQYASYCVLASPGCLTRWWNWYRILVRLQSLYFTEIRSSIYPGNKNKCYGANSTTVKK